MVFELDHERAPKAARNFQALCSGAEAPDGSGIKYAGSSFHRIIPGFMVQGGDITAGNGTGGMSIYGASWPDEPSALRVQHDRPGLLSMANAGPNTNGSQFFITCEATPHLDGKHMVFGELASGKEVLDAMTKVKTGQRDEPLAGFEVRISDAGVARPASEAPTTVHDSPRRQRSESVSSYSSSSSGYSSPGGRGRSRPAASAHSRDGGGERSPVPVVANDPELAAIKAMEQQSSNWLTRGRRQGRRRSRSPPVRRGPGGGARQGVKGRGFAKWGDRPARGSRRQDAPHHRPAEHRDRQSYSRHGDRRGRVGYDSPPGSPRRESDSGRRRVVVTKAAKRSAGSGTAAAADMYADL